MDDVEHGVRCDDCGRIYAPEDLIRVGDRFLCGECEELLQQEMEGDRVIAQEEILAEMRYDERFDRGMTEAPDY